MFFRFYSFVFNTRFSASARRLFWYSPVNVTSRPNHSGGTKASAEQTAVKAKQQAQEYLDGIVQGIEAERSKPTPKRKRQAEEEIALLRTENAALRQSKAISDRDRSDLFEQLQKAERRAKGKEQAFGMVSDMLAAYPDEFDALLNKSRAKNAAPSFKSHGNDRGGK